MNRLGIFLIYDEKGKIDRYIGYLLDNITQYLDRLILVCNGILSVEGRRYLEQFSSEIIVRDNVGFDFGAWKDIMINYLGFAQISEYDELILFNDSFFGPFDDFGDVFEKMESQNLDFWGLSVHGEVDTVKNMNPYGYRPRYIQTYFLAFQKRMLLDYSFANYWKNMPYFNKFLEAGEKGGSVLTHYFEQLGFQWGVYSDTSDWEESREDNICHHAFNTYDLITKRQYPIIKRKSFVLGKNRFLKYNTGRDLPKALEFIEKHTTYDTDMIYEHLIRKFHISDLKESMNLDFIIPTEYNAAQIEKRKILVIVELENDKNWDEISNTLNYLTNTLEVIVICSIEESEKIKKNLNNNIFIKEAEKNHLFIYNIPYAAILEYDYICVLNLSFINSQANFVVGKSATNAVLENLLFSSNYIYNIVSIFEKNKFIGLLSAPIYHHGNLLGMEQKNWDLHYENVKHLSDFLNLDAILDSQKSVPILDCALWCKPSIFQKLYNITESPEFKFDNQDVHLLYPYLAQDAGLFSGICMNDLFAATEYENLSKILDDIILIAQNDMVLDFDSMQTLTSKINIYIKEEKKQREENASIKKSIGISKGNPSKEPNVREVPVLVDIGVRGALKNWFRKKFGRK